MRFPTPIAPTDLEEANGGNQRETERLGEDF